MNLLGVSGNTLDAFGAVSEETALEMVEGVRKNSGSDICVSVTGIAGPDGGTEKKPVGLIYIGASYRNRTVCKKVQMRDVNRNWNRNYSMLQMFDVVNRLVDERPVRNKT